MESSRSTTPPSGCAGPGASIGPIDLRPSEFAALQVRFLPKAKRTLGVHVLTLDLEQIAEQGVVGGQRFVIKTTPDIRGVTLDRPGTVFDGVGWVKVGKSCSSCD